jgi:hydrogenase maturation protein HypF
MNQPTAYRILINGIVQGVGFRPFIYNLAIRHGLLGWVKNTSRGVQIEVSGPKPDLEDFLSSITSEAPPLSKIESINYEVIQPGDDEPFHIQHSQVIEGAFQPISADVSICDDCLQELFSADDFRYRYPFINCTNCGPRFTIIKDIPYDRPQTTMARFDLCPACEKEYTDPLNRRFHAQPVACPECGPEIWVEYSSQTETKKVTSKDEALLLTQELFSEGKIGAIKGLGGFHLACDAENSTAVEKLRKRKNRPAKPLAVMMPDLDTIRKFCLLSTEEEDLLLSRQRPILLLNRKPGSTLPASIAPGQNTIGVMLPYTPLHYLLFSNQDEYPHAPYSVLIMTSANFSGNPILTQNEQVQDLLGDIADFYLLHDRDIHIHCDDTVARVPESSTESLKHIYPIRRSRGYAPAPISSPLSGSSILAGGAELKNTFCLIKDQYAFLSQHIGDLKNYETLRAYQDSISHYESLFRIQPELLVYDLHPDYLSTRYILERAEEENLPALPVQHHHAHIAACLADNSYQGKDPVIGISFDGIGYGDDGKIWGGEFLIADYRTYSRAGHLAYFPLPGGDLAVKEPWRTAVSLLDQAQIPLDPKLFPVAYAQSLPDSIPGTSILSILESQLKTETNAPLTSSMGRLFDGVSSLLGICHQISYEGQAAIELEALADPNESGFYSLEISRELIFQPGAMITEILADLKMGYDIPTISARFHNTIAALALEMASRLKEIHELNQVALSGGVWQNMSLLRKSSKALSQAGFDVFIHNQVPANDGGLSLGQAVIGQRFLSK